MVSTKPYLVRAIYEWCSDQGFTPYLAARVDSSTRVPPGYAKDGQIVLNVGSDATNKLSMDNESISFQARFNGSVQHILIPMSNVLAVYARENGQGMAFEADIDEGEPFEEDAADDADATGLELAPEPLASSEPSESPKSGDDRQPPPRGGHLKVVK
ncbi:MAG: ClpXP protease specificity-enhancing factor [Betaproteobacteria bacterium HGW-Betaproteobacteria-13]|jgi:stringent starvation protein B|uniref:ClpXP protease specificity-enhancing factor n=1 Tax=Parazoarcus communis TaxID=41977 RepID=A0A2U8H4U9_9RHOO|nr:ClpXP protease specificity-enhancing factor [Parazoarcus communis]AWI79845.1 ClpXP protease specificity-enhancing factor [Parazoarcus communis]PKO60131.1 MAG: ClpXP protease specificity-enhancing factor [Betaproteobacteria bacterium HGW-Betaproteobacteria-19]PKO82096.1 MAG: ClpXP protease specificity-enhancing factor [Betaproteobacteria bacterium HGW-Betaproteobacteria-13]